MRSAQPRPVRRAVVVASFGLLLAVAATQADVPAAHAAGPTVTCTTDPAIVNTGYDGAGGRLLAGSDPVWEVGEGTDELSPSGVSTWTYGTIVTNPDGLWASSPYNTASWIASSATGGHVGHGYFYYRYQFTIDPTLEPSDFTVSLDFFADNGVGEVWVNSHPQSGNLAAIPQGGADPQQYSGFLPGNAANAILDRDWVAGQNEIIVLVESEGPATGFLAQNTSSIYCITPTPGAPAPTLAATGGGDDGILHLGAAALLLAGVGALLARRASGHRNPLRRVGGRS